MNTQFEPTNAEVARLLERISNLLETQGANPYRVQAYRTGAETVRESSRLVAELVHEDDELSSLKSLHGIGQGLATIIAEYVRSGRSSQLNRLLGEVSPVDLFLKVPGIGETLAQRLVQELDIETLEGLEMAAHDGRLEQVEGFGPKRVETIRMALAGLLSRSAQRRFREFAAGKPKDEERSWKPPSVATLLEVDEEYRRRAQADELKKISPRRFNPEGEAWLPIFHTEKEGWSFTALYSNTARAHELGKTKDWVVIYYERDGYEDQATVVTERRGPLSAKRVVRGREDACKRHYRSRA